MATAIACHKRQEECFICPYHLRAHPAEYMVHVLDQCASIQRVWRACWTASALSMAQFLCSAYVCTFCLIFCGQRFLRSDDGQPVMCSARALVQARPISCIHLVIWVWKFLDSEINVNERTKYTSKFGETQLTGCKKSHVWAPCSMWLAYRTMQLANRFVTLVCKVSCLSLFLRSVLKLDKAEDTVRMKCHTTNKWSNGNKLVVGWLGRFLVRTYHVDAQETAYIRS